jgi:hypothetical protein
MHCLFDVIYMIVDVGSNCGSYPDDILAIDIPGVAGVQVCITYTLKLCNVRTSFSFRSALS